MFMLNVNCRKPDSIQRMTYLLFCFFSSQFGTDEAPKRIRSFTKRLKAKQLHSKDRISQEEISKTTYLKGFVYSNSVMFHNRMDRPET